MVKKIKVVEDSINPDELGEQEYKAKVLEYLQAMDWKLWEMLKIAQRWAEENGYNETPEPQSTRKPDSEITPIIVDEDE